MTIALGCDHGGFDLKNIVMEHLIQKEYKAIDFGTFDNQSVDYPDFAVPVCEAVLSGRADFGILVCGTGIGISIAANKIRGIRCALAGDVYSAKACKAHNNANVLSLGARVVGSGLALEIVDAFLQTPFSEEARHMRRIQKMMDLESR